MFFFLFQQQQSPQQRPILVRNPTPGMNTIQAIPQQPQQQQQAIVNQGPNIVVQQQSPVPQSPIPQSPIPQSPVQQPPRYSVDTITSPVPQIQQQQVQQQQQQQLPNVDAATNQMQMNKTKTALQNMLSNRNMANTNNGTPVPIAGPEATVPIPGEPSAAGTLRMMTAQHNTTNLGWNAI